ncbi:MAG: phosphoribosylamine--glycine ligase [Fervidobacterium sp.]
MKEKSVCILGSGGREHAIGWAFKEYGFKVYFYPGNAGTKNIGYNINLTKFDELERFDLVIPGSEDFLVNGVANNKNNVFGPDSFGAKLEGSKCFAKKFMEKYSIPTSKFKIATNIEELREILRYFNPPYVIKADGLAAGKGVIICNNNEEALEKGVKLINGELIKNVKGPVVVEEFLSGWELSAIAIVNGEKFAFLPFTRDYKRAFTNNQGPNTGGMGSYGPTIIDTTLITKIKNIIIKTLAGLKKEGIFYRGFLYAGLMVVDNEPFVLEYNVRLGDPETEVIVPMNKEKFVENIILAFQNENFEEYKPEKYALDVVLASEGYPDNPKKGQVIQIKESKVNNEVSNGEKQGEHSMIFYAGVLEHNGNFIVNGGRVLHCVGTGSTLQQARQRAYEKIKDVYFEGMFYREDIGS